MEQKSSSLPEDLLEKSLYICTMDTYRVEHDLSCRYHIQVIKMSDLFSFSELAPFTNMFDPHHLPTTKLKFKIEDDEDHARQEIDFLESDDDGVPCRMGVGVFRSQFVFAGGLRYPSEVYSNRVYALDTERKQVIDINAATGDDDDFSTIPFYFLQSPKARPKLIEIKGKFYALDRHPRRVSCEVAPYYVFEVFDPNIGYWVSLRNPPPQIIEGYGGGRLSYLVAGTKIFIANKETPVYWFDVEGPTQKWEEIPVVYSSCIPVDMDQSRQLPIWDSIDLDLGDHRLVVYVSYERLYFFRFWLSKGTVRLQYVATMEMNVECHHSTCLTYLGAETICCVFMDPVIGLKVCGVIFTCKISFSRSAAAAGSKLITPVVSTDDPYFKITYPSKSFGNSFSAETLSWRTFEYQFPQTAFSALKYSEVVGLAVLPLHHSGHAFCKVCRSQFPNREALNKHLSSNKSCKIELPRVKCRFCDKLFPREELIDHIKTSLRCKSKFTGDGDQEKKCFSPYF